MNHKKTFPLWSKYEPLTFTSHLTLPQEILDYIMSFSAEGGNIDCIHPAQSVLDFLCGPNCMTYAAQLEAFFDAYADMRGIKSKMFKPLKSCVWSLVSDSPAFFPLRQCSVRKKTAIIRNNVSSESWLSNIFDEDLSPTGRSPGLHLRPLMLRAATTPWSCRWHVSSDLVDSSYWVFFHSVESSFLADRRFYISLGVNSTILFGITAIETFRQNEQAPYSLHKLFQAKGFDSNHIKRAMPKVWHAGGRISINWRLDLHLHINPDGRLGSPKGTTGCLSPKLSEW